jgi:two-component system nitrate/nitrite sensor histidine kinase NarX
MKNTASLSAKLIRIGAALLLTALVSIGLTLWVTWKLGGGAAALNEAGRMRMQVWRMTSAVQAGLPERATLVMQFDQSMQLLRAGDSSRPLFVPWDDEVRARFADVEKRWVTERDEFLGTPVSARTLILDANDFVGAIDFFVSSIERQMAGLTTLLNLFQFLMMAMAIAGAVVMLYTGYLYVISPLDHLRIGLRKLESGEFSTRVDVASNDEFGQVGASFNRMAATLESLYGSLEAKVEAKTRRIAAQKERLQALYDVSAFLASSNDLKAMSAGFCERVRKLMKADAIALRWSGDDQSRYLILASDQFPQQLQEEERCLRAGICACGNLAPDARTRVIPIISSDIAPLQHCTRIGFENLISVPIRLHQKLLGEIDLFFKRDVTLSVDEHELVDTLATHLASSIEGLRAVALEREAAVSGERAFLARELHDSIAQALAFLKIQVQLLRGAIARNDTPKAERALDELDDGLKECIADVRELLVHFRTRASGDEIETAVQETLQKFQHQTGLKVGSRIAGDGMPLPPDVQIQVLHILQEALSNVRKHAGASSVQVQVDKGPAWRFAVHDDGRGFDTDAERTQLNVGLKIMRERAEQIGATVDVSSAPGEGTTVSLALPANPRTRTQPVVAERT